MVEPVVGFCTENEHADILRGVVGFENDLARQRRLERRRDEPLDQARLLEAVDVEGRCPEFDFSEAREVELMEADRMRLGRFKQ